MAGWHVRRRRVEDGRVAAIGQCIYLAAAGIEESQAVAAVGQPVADGSVADGHQQPSEVREVLAETGFVAGHHRQTAGRQRQGGQGVAVVVVLDLPTHQADAGGPGIEHLEPLVARLAFCLDGVVLHLVDEDVAGNDRPALRRGRGRGQVLGPDVPEEVIQVVFPRSGFGEQDVIGVQHLAAAGRIGAHGDVASGIGLGDNVVGELSGRDQVVPAIGARGEGAQVHGLSIEVVVAVEVELGVGQRPAGVSHHALVDGAPEAPDQAGGIGLAG